MFTDNVDKVLSIFGKLIVRLEKIIEKKNIEISSNNNIISELKNENDLAIKEIAKAEMGIKKMSEFFA